MCYTVEHSSGECSGLIIDELVSITNSFASASEEAELGETGALPTVEGRSLGRRLRSYRLSQRLPPCSHVCDLRCPAAASHARWHRQAQARPRKRLQSHLERRIPNCYGWTAR